MQINVTGHHVDITDPMRDYVNEKFERLERHFDHVTDVHVVLSVEKLRHTAEATMHITGGKLFADSTEEDACKEQISSEGTFQACIGECDCRVFVLE